jgi:hypothetical protein
MRSNVASWSEWPGRHDLLQERAARQETGDTPLEGQRPFGGSTSTSRDLVGTACQPIDGRLGSGGSRWWRVARSAAIVVASEVEEA